MSKQIFTKTQAISILEQIKVTREIDIFKPVDASNKLFKLSCEEIEKKLFEHMQEEHIAGVVEDI